MRTYTITGQVFFASAERFVNTFDYKEVIDKVCIDVQPCPLLGHHCRQCAGQGGHQVPARRY